MSWVWAFTTYTSRPKVKKQTNSQEKSISESTSVLLEQTRLLLRSRISKALLNKHFGGKSFISVCQSACQKQTKKNFFFTFYFYCFLNKPSLSVCGKNPSIYPFDPGSKLNHFSPLYLPKNLFLPDIEFSQFYIPSRLLYAFKKELSSLFFYPSQYLFNPSFFFPSQSLHATP